MTQSFERNWYLQNTISKKARRQILFKGTWNIWIDHILSHKTRHHEFKRVETISSSFSDKNSMKPEINHRKKNWKKMNIWKLNNMLLKTQWVQQWNQDFPDGPVVENLLLVQGAWVQSLVREVRYQMPWSN